MAGAEDMSPSRREGQLREAWQEDMRSGSGSVGTAAGVAQDSLSLLAVAGLLGHEGGVVSGACFLQVV
jgi:hypothetical protein